MNWHPIHGGIPQSIMLLLLFVGLGLSWARDGQPKTGNENAKAHFASVIIAIVLLYWGGFF